MTVIRRSLNSLPYILLTVVFALIVWTFAQMAHHGQQMQVIWRETDDILWRSTQARDKLTRTQGYLLLARETGKVEPDLNRQLALLKLNVNLILKLPYLRQYLPQEEVMRLEASRNIVEDRLIPSAMKQSDFSAALRYASEVDQAINETIGATVDPRPALEETARIHIDSSRNWLIFFIGLGMITVLYLVLHQRLNFTRQRNQHLRSFASLFVHTTRSRIAGLNLFLNNGRSNFTCSEDMLKAARAAVNELDTINQSLLTIAYPARDPNTEPLGALLQDVVADKNGSVRLEVGTGTANLPLPATQFRLLASELIQNAETATRSVAHRDIVVTTAIRQRKLFGRRYLSLEVRDNGIGMPPHIRDKALTPFFSTNTGSHAGLGLTACAEMIATLKGKMTIHSKPDEGTSVSLGIPIRRSPV